MLADETAAIQQMDAPLIQPYAAGIDIDLRSSPWQQRVHAGIQRDVERRQLQLIMKVQRDELSLVFDQLASFHTGKITGIVAQLSAVSLHPQLQLPVKGKKGRIEQPPAAIAHIAPDDGDRIGQRCDLRIVTVTAFAETLIQPQITQRIPADDILRKDDQIRLCRFRLFDEPAHLCKVLLTVPLPNGHGHHCCLHMHHRSLV